MMSEKPYDICDRTFLFAVEVVKLCRQLDAAPGVSRTLATQLLRSGTSIAANVEEAQAGYSNADFRHKMSIALKEARETRYWLRLLVASGVLAKDTAEPLSDESNQLCRILGAILSPSRNAES